jgi:hypothetical protein
MAQMNISQSEGRRPAPVQMSMLALRGMGQVYDINFTAARMLLQTQARAASLFGLPDWTGLFEHGDERTRSLLSGGAEQLVQQAERVGEAAAELQRQVGRVVETQASTMVETLHQGIDELGNQTTEALKQLCDTARQQADEAERAAQTMSQTLRETVRQGGEKLRDVTRQGGEQVREATRQGAEQARDAAQQAGEETRDAAQRGRGRGGHTAAA